MNKAVWPFSSTEWICSGIRYLMISIFHRKQRTALHLAAASGHDDVARLLLTSGSDILAVDKCRAILPEKSCILGGTPRSMSRYTTLLLRTLLRPAAASGHDDVARLLLTSGSDILAVDNRGWSALHCADFR
jgi:ankyrin repeat protein